MQSLTVLTASPNRTLTKNHNTGETYAKTSRLVAAEARAFASLKELKRILSELASAPNRCVIRGVQKPDVSGVLRRRKSHFDDAPQAWVMLDLDALKWPKRLRSLPYTDAHALYASRRLPAAFHGCGFVWQASASAGVDLKVGKMHLWFLLDAPLTAAQLRVWLKGAEAVDPSTLRCVQPHYTADPIGGPYVGSRLGVIKGPRVTTPVELAEVVPESSSVEMTPRPKGSADVSDALIEHAKKTGRERARELLDGCSVAYMDAYTAGTLLGPWVALRTWNDKKHGHNTWREYADKLARGWGEAFAQLEGANHGVDVYAARVLEGITWGVSQERERLAKKSQKVADEAIERTKIVRDKLLQRALTNVGSETVMREVAQKLGAYKEVVPEVVHQLAANSGFTEHQVLKAMEGARAVALDGWREGLLMLKDEVQATDENIALVLARYPGFLESFERNERSRNLEATPGNVLGLPVGVADVDVVAVSLVEWLGSIGMRKASMHRVLSVFKASQSRFASYDPFIRLFPEALLPPEAAKSQLPRKALSTRWLSTHFGAVGDVAYVQAVASKTLIAAVARAVEPGAQVDTMLVLIGEQGIGKTSALRTLGSVIDGGYTELLSMSDKDSILGMHKSVIVEVSEMRALRSTHEEMAKAFWSRRWDRLRAPYAREAEEMKRRMVFIGTTNDDDFLSDRANRRYWPVVCSGISRMSPDQADALWRDAALRYAAGEKWWLQGSENEAQVLAVKGHRAENTVESVLRKWVKGRDRFTLLDATKAAFPEANDPHKHSPQVAFALKALGLKSVHTMKGNRWMKG